MCPDSRDRVWVKKIYKGESQADNTVFYSTFANTPHSALTVTAVMRWQISCYMDMDQIINWGCSVALLNSWLICFALSYIYFHGLGSSEISQNWMKFLSDVEYFYLEIEALELHWHLSHLSPGSQISSRLWLVETDHVTRILASDWSIQLEICRNSAWNLQKKIWKLNEYEYISDYLKKKICMKLVSTPMFL